MALFHRQKSGPAQLKGTSQRTVNGRLLRLEDRHDGG
jgi:hypothetical protein